MNWTRDRVRRLARISANAALLSADLQMLIHELGPEDPGKEKLTVANEELSRAELAIDDAASLYDWRSNGRASNDGDH